MPINTRAPSSGRPEWFTGELTRAEQIIAGQAALGRCAEVWPDGVAAHRRRRHEPDEGNQRLVHADFLVALLASEQWPVHPRGVLIDGAIVEEEIDLTGALIEHPVEFWNCDLAGGVRLEDAKTRSLLLSDSRCTDLYGEGLCVEGTLRLINGFCASTVFLRNIRVSGSVCLSGASIGTVPLCEEEAVEEVVNLEGARIEGGLFLDESELPILLPDGSVEVEHLPFTASGGVRISDAAVGSSLSFQGSIPANPYGVAVEASGVSVGGSVSLDRVIATGAVRLCGASIGGNLSVQDSHFTAAGWNDELEENPSNPEPAGNMMALTAQSATIGGSLLMAPREVQGTLSLEACIAGDLLDTLDCWEQPSSLRIEGFTYGAFAGPVERGVVHRIDRMVAKSEPFSRQPYTHLAHVYRQAGEAQAARKVMIAMRWDEFHRVPAAPQADDATLAKRAWALTRAAAAKARRWMFGVSVGFGYRPFRLLLVASVLLLLGSAVFAFAIRDGGLIPANGPVTVQGHEVVSSDCTSDYPCAQAFIYSLDALLPVIDLGQDQHWVPQTDGTTTSGQLARWTAFAMALAGWAIIGVSVGGAAERLRDPA